MQSMLAEQVKSRRPGRSREGGEGSQEGAVKEEGKEDGGLGPADLDQWASNTASKHRS